MTNKDIYKIWAPTNKKWVDWVRPVPFISINTMKTYMPTNLTLPCLQSVGDHMSTAIIIDLPGAQSVEAGILLAKQGYRPVPIYNGTIEQIGSRATSDNASIASALVWGASILSAIEIKDDAPPVFLTDANRLQRYKIDYSIFDNSWDVYHQDLPTEEYLLNNGIKRILVIGGSRLAKDLKKVFAEHTKKKVAILWSDGYSDPKLIRKGR